MKGSVLRVDDVIPNTVRQGLHELHQNLHQELERLEALLAVGPAREVGILTSNGGDEKGLFGAAQLQHKPTELPPPPEPGGMPELACSMDVLQRSAVSTTPSSLDLAPAPPEPVSEPEPGGKMAAECPQPDSSSSFGTSTPKSCSKWTLAGEHGEMAAECPQPDSSGSFGISNPKSCSKWTLEGERREVTREPTGKVMECRPQWSEGEPGRTSPEVAVPPMEKRRLSTCSKSSRGSKADSISRSRTCRSIKGAPTWEFDDLAHKARSEAMEKRKRALAAFRAGPPNQKMPNRRVNLAEISHFEVFFAMAILMSALINGAEVQYTANHVGEESPRAFFVIQLFFNALFLVELILRIYSDGLRRFVCSEDNWMWAWLDIIVCVASVLESMLDILVFLLAGFEGNAQQVRLGPFRIVRMIRLLRLARAFRLQRFIRFVTSLRTLVYSIAVTLKSLFWAMVLLVMIVYVVALCFTQFTIDYSLDPEAEAQVVCDMKHFWGSLDRSMLTLFQSISGGLSWRDAALPMERVSVLLVALFVLYISFVYFAVLNVVTGVFCSSAIETAQRTPELIARSLIENQHAYAEHLKKLFRNIDKGNTGVITLSEFERLREDEMTLAYFRALEIDFADAWTVFRLIDKDKGGAIDMNEFVYGCQQLRGVATSLEMQDMAYDLRKMSSCVEKFIGKTNEQLSTIRSVLRGMGDKKMQGLEHVVGFANPHDA